MAENKGSAAPKMAARTVGAGDMFQGNEKQRGAFNPEPYVSSVLRIIDLDCAG